MCEREHWPVPKDGNGITEDLGCRKMPDFSRSSIAANASLRLSANGSLVKPGPCV